MDHRHRPHGASCHVIRMRKGPNGLRAGPTTGMRWEDKKGREGGCGEDLRLKSGGYFATQHRITAGGLPTGNTCTGIATAMFGEAWEQEGVSLGFEPQFVAHRADGVGSGRHTEHIAANFSLIGYYGPGPGGYSASSDIRPPLTDRVPGYFTCQACGMGGHWTFDCPSAGRRRTAGTSPLESLEFEEAASMLAPASDAEPGPRLEMRVCSSRSAGEECWGRARWLTEADLVAPAATRSCKHCARPGHYTYDCHRVGLGGGEGVAACPACRLVDAVLVKTGGGLKTLDYEGAGRVAGSRIEVDDGPHGKAPAYYTCSTCRKGGHFRCECKDWRARYARELAAKKKAVLLAGGKVASGGGAGGGMGDEGTPEGGEREPGWKQVPARHGCQKCGRGHWTWDCPKLKEAKGGKAAGPQPGVAPLKATGPSTGGVVGS